MERKFKVGDTVKLYGSIGKIVFVSQNKASSCPYCLEFDDKSIGCFSEVNLTLIEPERKFKKGDEVWHNVERRRYVFSHYYEGVCIVNNGLENVGKAPENLEPYTGQDKEQTPAEILEHNIKVVEEILDELHKDISFVPDALPGVNLMRKGYSQKVGEPIKPAHPYTVILKSGVKVGISATIFDYINEQNSDTKSVQTVADGTIVLSEIAAIVPTENIQ